MRKQIEKYCCIKCRREISVVAITRHNRSCSGAEKNIKAPKECEFCLRVFKTGSACGLHRSQCKSNPKRKTERYAAWNKGKTKFTDDRILKCSESLLETIKRNPNFGRCVDAEKEILRRRKISERAKELGFGGYRENAGRSKKYKVVDTFGKPVTLQSSYELTCASILNELNIQWIRPGALKYSGRNYFPDFFLPEYDLYLDPKNEYRARLDYEKIESVKDQNNVKVCVILKDELTKEGILALLESLIDKRPREA